MFGGVFGGAPGGGPFGGAAGAVPVGPQYQRWRSGGMILALLGIVTLGLGIGDLIYSRAAYCQSDTFSTSCSSPSGTNYPNVLTFTWISAGIWGGALVLLAALATMQLARTRDPQRMRTWTYLGMFVALLVIPGMIVMEVVLLYYITTNGGGFYTLGGDNTSQYTILFALPIAVGVLGILDFLVIGFMLLSYMSRQARTSAIGGVPGGTVVSADPAGISDPYSMQMQDYGPQPQPYDPYGGVGALPPPPGPAVSDPWPYPRPYAPKASPYSRSPSNYFGDSGNAYGYGGGGYGGGYGNGYY